MIDSFDGIPERVETGEHYYLNCELGGKETPSSSSEAFVLEHLETTLSDSFLQIYYRYPDTGRREDNQYIDIVALHPKTGILVLEILESGIGDLNRIRGPDWYLEGEPRPIHPESIASDGKIAIRHQIENIGGDIIDKEGRSIVRCQDFVALPNISRREWEEEFETKKQDKLLFREEIEDRDHLYDKLISSKLDELDEDQLRATLGALKFSDAISGDQLNSAATPTAKRELLEHIGQRLKILTDQQLEIGLQSPDGPQRIRGIAGSGKTVVTAFRAAKLHWENQEWNIAVTFRNRGLRQTHEKLISAFYKQFSNGDDFNRENLHIYHAWGGNTPGMYSEISTEAGVNRLTYNQASQKFRYTRDKLAACCREVLSKGNVPHLFDAILIDEGQDLPATFFQMCYRACTSEKRLYWSYDEAQSLGTLEARTPRELFGEDSKRNPVVNLSENYSGGINPSHVMRVSFRTPRSVLMTAHGFGMGMYRDGPVIQTITNKRGWEDLGYEVEGGNFRRTGSKVTLRRPLSNSPHPLWEYQSPGELINQHYADNRSDEISWVVNDITDLINEEDVLPEEILITFLWSYNEREELLNWLIDGLEDQFDSPKNIINDVSHITRHDGSRGQIKKPGQISLSNIYHARGNEAPIVYVMGLDMVAEQTSKEITEGKEKTWREQHVDIRNKAFVGFTRTQGWLKITGSDPGSRVVAEINKVLQDTQSDNPKLTLEVPPENSPFKDLEPHNYEYE